MGKSKSRILRKGINNQFQKISRIDAISMAVEFLNNKNLEQAKSIISMFGLNAEELLEADASYESIIAIKSSFNYE